MKQLGYLMTVKQKTELGEYHIGDSLELLKSDLGYQLKGKVNLILTSPPYLLNRKKKYGNHTEEEYLEWFVSMAPIFSKLLTDDGSVVIELGNSWEPNRPIQSLLPLESLLGFVKNKNANFRLCQQFTCYNPSRLPSPAPWVTQKRIRTTDSYTNIWWMAKSDYPKADNSKVLRPYSKSQKQLQKRGTYNSGLRPSEHNISESGFLKDNGGSIAHNFFELEAMDSKREVRLPNSFAFSNTSSNDFYHRKCREQNLNPHPARMPMGLASFFINLLTEEHDLVLDPFGGSNTTGYTSEKLNRKWISIEAKEEYLAHSEIRFQYYKE